MADQSYRLSKLMLMETKGNSVNVRWIRKEDKNDVGATLLKTTLIEQASEPSTVQPLPVYPRPSDCYAVREDKSLGVRNASSFITQVLHY